MLCTYFISSTTRIQLSAHQNDNNDYLIDDCVIPIHIVVSPAVIAGGREIGAVFSVHFTLMQGTSLLINGDAFVDKTPMGHSTVMFWCPTWIEKTK